MSLSCPFFCHLWLSPVPLSITYSCPSLWHLCVCPVPLSVTYVSLLSLFQTKNGCFINSRTDRIVSIRNVYETADEYHARILSKVSRHSILSQLALASFPGLSNNACTCFVHNLVSLYAGFTWSPGRSGMCAYT